MQYYNFALVFLLCLKVSFTDCQTLPYSLTKTDRELNSNTLTLQCMGRLGSVVHNAVFYRNGVLNTSDDCFDSSVSVATNKLRFTISPECDGHYMCGARNGSGVVLSNSITIHGEYFHLSRYTSNQNLHINSLSIAFPVQTGIKRNIVGEEGRSITLPCDFERSPINIYTTKWFKPLGSQSVDIATYDGEIRDLVIENLHQTDKGLYRCQLRPPDGSNAINGPLLNLTVNATYSKYFIIYNFVLTMNNEVSVFSCRFCMKL